MKDHDRAVLDDQATRDAAERLVSFLQGELEQLPRGHAWRKNYSRQLVRTLVLYPGASAEA